MVATADESRLGNSTQKYVFLPAGTALSGFQPQERAAERGGNEGSQHRADPGKTHRAGFLIIHFQPVGDQCANAAAGIRQGGFRTQAGSGDERYQSGDYDPRRVAVIKTPGPAEFKHQLGKDGIMVTEQLDQQPNQQTSKGTNKEGEETGIQAERQGCLLPNEGSPPAYKEHERKCDQGTDQTQQYDKP